MKKIFSFIFILLSVSRVSIAQNWLWAKQAGSTLRDNFSTVVHDNNDNLYASGITKASGAFNFYFGNDTLSGNGYGHVIAKYDVNGNEVWIKALREDNGGNGSGGIKIIYDKYSDVVIATGVFSGILTCDTFSVTSFIDPSTYMAKFDHNGNCLWLKFLFSTYLGGIGGADVDSSGNIYCFASLSTPYYYNSNNDTIHAGGNFIKLDSNGNILWKKNKVDNAAWYLGSTYQAYSMKIINSKMYLSGDMRKDTLQIDTITIINTNQAGIILSAFDMSANVQWAKATANPNTGGGYTISLDSNKNIYTMGNMSSPTLSSTVAYFSANDSIYNNSPYGNGFLAKFDSLGNYLWARNIITSSGYALVSNCSTSPESNTYVIGYFKGTANFGIYSASSTDTAMFITRYDASGNCLGVMYFQKAFGSGLTTLSNGSPVVSGNFAGSVTIGSNSFTSYGDYDSYITELDEFTGIKTEARLMNNQLIIYANPNSGKCNITVPDDFLHEKNLTLQIFNNNGKMIQQKSLEMNEGKIKVSLDEEAKGIYNVILGNGRKSYNGRIVFE